MISVDIKSVAVAGATGMAGWRLEDYFSPEFKKTFGYFVRKMLRKLDCEVNDSWTEGNN